MRIAVLFGGKSEERVKGRYWRVAWRLNRRPARPLSKFEDVRSLPVGEIFAPGEVFDYQSKYQAGEAREVFPANLPVEESTLLQEYALRAHLALVRSIRHSSEARSTPAAVVGYSFTATLLDKLRPTDPRD